MNLISNGPLKIATIIISSIVGGILIGYLIFKFEIIFLLFLLTIIPIYLIFYYIYLDPINGVKLVLILSFLVNGLVRYAPSVPLGLAIDGILVLTLVISLFSPSKPDTSKLGNLIILITVLWFLSTLLQIINPEARSLTAWFYAVRAYSIYQILMIPLLILYFSKKKQLYNFVDLILIWCIIAALWGYKQIFIGLDGAEWSWLMAGAIKTHVLFGVLRAFSFLSDSGQFGATMGYGAIVSILLAVGPFSFKRKIFFLITGLICLYAMALSGTRGALFVPFGASGAYLVATKNFKSIFFGGIIVGLLFSFLKFTTIGQDNNQIRRMRSALDPEDPSLQVRLENQKLFKQYLSTRPFGGGIGSNGSWGQRFSPGTFLAETPNDSWYVKIWAETGIIGLIIHGLMLGSIMFYGYYVIFTTKDLITKQYFMALNSGYVGILFASYGNPILGQFPINIILYFTWAVFFVKSWK